MLKNEEITLIDHILKLLDLTSGSIILWHDRAITCPVRRYDWERKQSALIYLIYTTAVRIIP